MAMTESVIHVADKVLIHFMDWFENLVPLIIYGLEG